jgi:hypothetical protein
MDARERLAAYLVGQVVAVTTLTLVVVAMLGLGGTHVSRVLPTTPVVVVARGTVEAVTLAALACCLTVPVAILLGFGRGVDDRVRLWIAAGFALLGPATLAVGALVGFVVGYPFGRVITAVLLVVGLPALGWFVARLLGGVDGDSVGPRFVAVVGVVVSAGLFVGVAAGVGATDALVTDHDRVGSPQVAFEFTYRAGEDGGRLTVRHTGGDSLQREYLEVVGSGFAPVDGAEQTEPGEWEGGARDGVVTVGNETTVGVTGDCDVRVVYRRPPVVTTLDRYQCP